MSAAGSGTQATGGDRPDAPPRDISSPPPEDPHRQVLTAVGGAAASSGGVGGARAAPPSAAGGAPANRARGGAVAIAGRVASGGRGGAPVSSGAGTGGMVETTAGRAPLAGASPNDSGMRHDQGGTVGSAGGAGAGGTEAGAAGQISLPPGSDWYCVQLGSVCTCEVFDSEPFGNFCLQPMPTCCITLLDDDKPNCQCWPQNSPECRVSSNEAFVPKCPL